MHGHRHARARQQVGNIVTDCWQQHAVDTACEWHRLLSKQLLKHNFLMSCEAPSFPTAVPDHGLKITNPAPHASPPLTWRWGHICVASPCIPALAVAYLIVAVASALLLLVLVLLLLCARPSTSCAHPSSSRARPTSSCAHPWSCAQATSSCAPWARCSLMMAAADTDSHRKSATGYAQQIQQEG